MLYLSTVYSVSLQNLMKLDRKKNKQQTYVQLIKQNT